jgi:fatty acid desaturase
MLTKEELQDLSHRSSSRSLSFILFDWFIILLAWMFAGYFDSWWAYTIAFVVIARQQLALIILAHEGAHNRLSSSRTMNERLHQIIMAPLIVEVHPYKEYHLQHHQAPLLDDDPDYALNDGPFPKSKSEFYHDVLMDLLGATSVRYIIFKLTEFTHWVRGEVYDADSLPRVKKSGEAFTRGQQYLMHLTAHLLIIIFLSMAGYGHLYILLWFLPLITLNTLFIRLRAIVEHSGFEPNPDQGLCTRTIHNPLQNLLMGPHNMSYHNEHHQYPTVTCDNLPELHRLLKEKGGIPENCVSNSYWDVLKSLLTD